MSFVSQFDFLLGACDLFWLVIRPKPLYLQPNAQSGPDEDIAESDSDPEFEHMMEAKLDKVKDDGSHAETPQSTGKY